GVADAELLFDAVDAVAGGDAAAALGAVARLSRSGRDAGQFLRDLETHARELLVVQTLGEVPAELRVTVERDERLAEQAGRVGRAEVVRLLDLLANGLGAIHNGSAPAPHPAGAFDLYALRSVWPAVLDTVREQNPMLAALLDGPNPIALAGDELTGAFSESRAFLKRKAEDTPNREALAAAIQTV